MKKPFKNYKILNRKQIKEFHQDLKEQFNFEGKLDYNFFQKNDKIYIVSKALNEIQLEKLNLNSLGLYIAKKESFGIRLSIEGSQLIGPKSKKNILEVKDSNPWLTGENIESEKEFKQFVIIKHKKDYLGSGPYKDHKILNHVPKSRRTSVS